MIAFAASMFGGAAFLAVMASASFLKARLDADVEWADRQARLFTPESPPQRPRVILFYATLAVCASAALMLLPNRAVAAGLIVGAIFLPRVLTTLAWSRRRDLIELQLPQAIRSVANCVGAGMTLVQAIETAAVRSPRPIRSELLIMANRYSLGVDLRGVLDEARERLNLPSFTLFASALLTNRELGGNVAVTLERISKSLESLHQMKMKVRAATASGRTNIKFLSASPFVIFALLFLMDPEGVMLVFTTSMGHAIIGFSGVVTLFAVYWASKIVNLEI